MTTKDTARQHIAALVQRYHNTPEKERRAYNENQTRISFILPLFEALGWNISDPAEVSAEENIARGFVDFGFYINGVQSFYLETKRVSESINTREHVNQAINYSYLKGVTWAVLTNFEELALFNADWETKHPDESHVFTFRFEDYAEVEFERLWMLSRPAMQERALDKYAERYGKKTRKQPIADVLFKQLIGWRRDLFNNFRAYGGVFAGDSAQVDNEIQKLFDRLIFLRAAEDRGIESPHLKELTRAGTSNLFDRLIKLFAQMNGVYNSNLFEPSQLDALKLNDDLLLRSIIEGLYRSPNFGYGEYDFRAISADVLGKVYEQYLGFKATDPVGKEAVGAEKSKKRKAQGIFYTPQFVVRYIVQNTLGKLLANGADPRTIRVVDPACGSGSFLIEAFDVLDRAWKTVEPDMPAAERRRRILMENLYGVDLDPQAVEVTRLNLVLRASLERGRLPLLTHIQRGNSLIDDPAVAGDAAFDWRERFPQVFEQGGFDVVIGNPPYVRQESLGEAFKAYAASRYQTHTGAADLYVYFIEKGIELLRPDGLYSVIVANKWLRANYGQKLRRFLTAQHVQEIVDFGDLPVFPEAVTYPCILTVGKSTPTDGTLTAVVPAKTLEFTDLQTYADTIRFVTLQNELDPKGWSLSSSVGTHLLIKLKAIGVPLGDYINYQNFYGIKTGLNEAFLISESTRKNLIAREPAAAEHIKPFLMGRDVRHYQTPHAEQYLLLFPNGWTRQQMNTTSVVDEWDAWEWFKSQFPACAAHLAPFSDRARRRADQGEFWWELRPCAYYNAFEKPKIIYPDLAQRGEFLFDTKGLFCSNTNYFFPCDDLAILGILNSRLITFFCQQTFAAYRGGFYRFFQQYVTQIPIRRLNLDDPAQRAQHDRMVELVQTMIALKQEHAAELMQFGDQRRLLEERIAKTDREIDSLVYDLYGLTDEERALVESTVT